MSLNVTLNGSVFIIPETGEVGWGSNLNAYFVAIAAGVLQKTGGLFTLSAETDFGSSFGLKSLSYKSRTANVASTGIVRLANLSDTISWRNAANSADLALTVNASNLLSYNGGTVYTIGAGTITNADVASGAGIVYSKLNLSNSIVNADVNTSAAIDYSKLNVPAGAIVYSKLTLTNSVVNADINSSAAIAYSKLALSNSLVNADVNSSAAIAYSKLNLSNSILNADINASAAIAYSKLNLSNSILNADINSSASIAFSKMAVLTFNKMLASNSSGVVTATDWGFDTSDHLTTGPQKQVRFQDLTGGEYVALRAPSAVTTHTYDLPVAPGTAGQVLSWQSGGQLTWINAAGGGTINSGLAGFFTYYPANGTTVDDQAVLSTDGTVITSTGSFRGPNGSLSTPTYSFTSDPDTGFKWQASGIVDFVSNGVVLATLATNSFQTTDGTEALPGLTFIADVNTGIYRPSADQMTFVTGGTGIFRVDTSLRVLSGHNLEMGTTSVFLGSDGTAALPSYAFQNDPDTGIFRVGANDIAIVTGGVKAWEADTTAVYPTLVTRTYADGSVSAPTYSFGNDADTGFYRSASGNTRYSANGVNVVSFINGGLEISDSAAVIANQAGTNLLPSYTFTADPDTGFYTAGTANTIRATCGGVQQFRLDTTGLYVVNQYFGKNGTLSSPSYSFDLDTDTGFYKDQAGSCAITSDGVTVARFYNINSIDRGIVAAFGGFISTPDGTVAQPSFRWDSDPDTGIYRPGTNQVGLVSGGAIAILTDPTAVNFYIGGSFKWQIDSASLLANGNQRFYNGQGSTALPSYSFNTDTDTGFKWQGSGLVDYSSNGTTVFTFTDKGFQTADGSAAGPASSFINDSDTGFYRVASGDTGYSGNGTVSLRFLPTTSAVSSEGTLLVHFNGLGLRQLNYGAADSAGAGFRTVRIPN